MPSGRMLAAAILTLTLVALALGPAAISAQNDSPASTPGATPAAIGTSDCDVDPIDPVAYGDAVRAASDPGERRPLDDAEPADETTVAAVTAVIDMSVSCTNAGDMSRLLALTDPAFAPSMLGVDRADVQPEIDRAVAEAPAAGETGDPLVEESDGQPVTPTLLGIGDIVTFSDGLVAADVEIESLQTRGRVDARVYLLPVDDSYLIFDWYVP